MVWAGFRVAAQPPDEDHPYGHGKAEPLAALAVAGFVFVWTGSWRSSGPSAGLLLGGAPLSDVQLFSQLRNLQDIRAALQTIGTDTALAMAGEVDKLLEGVFESSKWTG